MITFPLRTLLLSFFATSTALGMQLDKDDFILTHKTNHFPQNGVMVPGLCFTTKTTKTPVHVTKAPNIRLTLHWYGMGMHEAHDGNKNQEKYLLIESGKDCAERLYGGYHEDFIMVGPHMLSPSSLAIVPEAEIESLRSQNQLFKGKWYPYNSKSETLEEAAKHIIKTQLHKPTVSIIKEYNESKLDKQKLSLLQTMIQQDPTISHCLQNRQDGWYFVQEVTPDQLNLSVNGKKVNAKKYYASVLPKTFKWGPHEETLFKKLENEGSYLFAPLLDLQSPNPTKLQLDREKLIEIAKMFVATYQNIGKIKLPSTSYPMMLNDYMEVWKKNTSEWYKTITTQATDLKTKRFEETLFGDENRLKEEIAKKQKSLKTFEIEQYIKS